MVACQPMSPLALAKAKIGSEEEKEGSEIVTRQDHVLKQVHHDVGIKPKTLTIFAFSPFLRIAAEAEKLAKVGGKVTVTSLDVQTAVSLLVSGDLAKLANADGGCHQVRFNSRLKSNTLT